MPVIVDCAGFRTNLTRLTLLFTLLSVNGFEIEDQDVCPQCDQPVHLNLLQVRGKKRISETAPGEPAPPEATRALHDIMLNNVTVALVRDLTAWLPSADFLTRRVRYKSLVELASGNTSLVVVCVCVAGAIFLMVLVQTSEVLTPRGVDGHDGDTVQWKCRESCSRGLQGFTRSSASQSPIRRSPEAAERKFIFENGHRGEPGHPLPLRQRGRQAKRRYLGIEADWKLGLVTHVFPGEQAHRLGVRIGMRFLTVDGCPYTENRLDAATDGIHSYEVTAFDDALIWRQEVQPDDPFGLRQPQQQPHQLAQQGTQPQPFAGAASGHAGSPLSPAFGVRLASV